MSKVVQIIELDLTKKLPKKIGIACDDWIEFAIHHLAVFAVGTGTPNGKALLGFSPFGVKLI